MKEKEKLKAYSLLMKYSFSVSINCNDFFNYACSEEVVISESDFEWVLPIINKFGDDGVNAVCCCIYGGWPISKKYYTRNFFEAVNNIIEINPTIYSLEYGFDGINDAFIRQFNYFKTTSQ